MCPLKRRAASPSSRTELEILIALSLEPLLRWYWYLTSCAMPPGPAQWSEETTDHPLTVHSSPGPSFVIGHGDPGIGESLDRLNRLGANFANERTVTVAAWTRPAMAVRNT
jgi:hypothetical protein